MSEKLNSIERNILLRIARESITDAANHRQISEIKLDTLPDSLNKIGASFVTLTKHGDLRGCIGALEAYQSLAQDVQDHAIAAATEDYRFSPVRPSELAEIHIEISYLTEPHNLDYAPPTELIKLLRPGIDGVIIGDGRRRATFLPQVWKQLPDPVEFLSHLCLKMGANSNLWRQQLLQVQTYQVEEFQEPVI